jgi:hypothetical protein
VLARVEAVYELRLGGAGFADVREWARAPKDRDGKDLPPWDVSDSQLWRYIAAADRLCKDRYDARADHLLARHLIRRERLYAHTLEVGDFRTALAVLKDQAQLEGHYQRTDPGAALEALLAALPADLAKATRAALAALLPGAGAEGGGAGAVTPAEGGPEPDPEPGPGGDEAGLLASEPAALECETDVAPLLPPGREEPDGRGAGPEDRIA